MPLQFQHFGSRTIAYHDSAPGDGTRRKCVWLHAFPLSAAMWEPQLQHVPEGWRFIAPDLRGFGGSSESDPNDGQSIDDFASDVVALLAELGITQAVLCGLSMGGYATFAILRHFPHLAEALVLADTRAGADSPEGRANRRGMIALVDREGPPGVARDMMPKLLGKTTRETNPQVEPVVRHLINRQSPSAIRGGILRMMQRPDSHPLLATTTVPTLVIVGEEDELTPPAESKRIAEAIPGSTLVVIPKAGHLSSLECPDEFNQAVASFLGRI
ncbi:MAG: alpha/beta fold hydrolase [Vicinamibacterales bacterium]